MTVITGGRTGTGPAGETAPGAAHALPALPSEGSNEAKVLDAVLACVARWGMQKTTIDDVARESGLSRATVYRLFPGGKPEMLRSAVLADVARLAAELTDELALATDLEDCLVRGLLAAGRHLHEDAALAFLLEHEPASVEAHLAFDRLDGLFATAAAVVAPALAPHLADPGRSAEAAVWAARLLVSYFLHPSPAVDLTDEAHVRRLVTTHLLPGLAPERPVPVPPKPLTTRSTRP